MKRRCLLLPTTMLLLLSVYITDIALKSTCPTECSYNLKVSRIKCKNYNFNACEEVRVTILPIDPYRPIFQPVDIFCTSEWKNAKYLTLKGNAVRVTQLRLNLRCLDQLKSLRITGLRIFIISFSGQTNVTTLEVSDSSIPSASLLYYLSVKTYFPKLRNLIISRSYLTSSYSSDHSILLSQHFVNALTTRPIQVLQLISAYVTFNFTNSSKLCDSLATLILRDSVVNIIDAPQTCESLKIVDISGTTINGRTFRHLCSISFVMVFHLREFLLAPVLYMDRMFPLTDEDSLINCVAQFDTYRIKLLQFSNNYLPHFQIIFFGDTLENINLSQNRIETIGTDVFGYLPSLKKIDLSFNRLHQADYIAGLFVSNIHLASIDVTANSLVKIPSGLFSEKFNLKEMNLSNNAITQVDFSITQLYNLTMLDLRYNEIKYLDVNFRNMIDDLFKTKTLGHKHITNETLQIYLIGNPFSCSCKSMEFLRWLIESPVFGTTRHLYHCTVKGEQITINSNAVNVASDICERPIRERRTILVSTIVPGFGISVTCFLVVFQYRKRKRRLKKQTFEDRLHLIRRENNETFRFPVFLSYSSLDRNFVAVHVRQPLQRHMQAITEVVDRDLVCDADIHFTPGERIFKEMDRCLKESAVLVAVISKNYCKSDYCQIEISEARASGKPILLIFKEHVKENKMPIAVREVFRKFTRITFVEEDGQYKIQPSWEQVCESIIQLL